MTSLPLIIAARWWADRVQQVATRDNGAPAPIAKLPADAPDWIVAAITEQYSPTKTVPANYAESLYEVLLRLLCESTDDPIMLRSDYGPQDLLADAADEAMIDPKRFPWKTTMWVTQTLVNVREGYGGAVQILWEAGK